MENREFNDVVAALQEMRENDLPRYASLVESIFGEQRRVSEQKLEQVRKMQEGGSYE